MHKPDDVNQVSKKRFLGAPPSQGAVKEVMRTGESYSLSDKEPIWISHHVNFYKKLEHLPKSTYFWKIKVKNRRFPTMILKKPTEDARKYETFLNENTTGEWKPCDQIWKKARKTRRTAGDGNVHVQDRLPKTWTTILKGGIGHEPHHPSREGTTVSKTHNIVVYNIIKLEVKVQ